MKYEKAQDFSGELGHVFDKADRILMSNSFQLIQNDDEFHKYKGPGMRSSKQNALLGASEICIKGEDGELHVVAKLGGARNMILFIMIFPFTLLGSLTLLFSVQGKSLPTHDLLIIALVLLILSPIMSFFMYKRTVRALDVFVGNIVGGC